MILSKQIIVTFTFPFIHHWPEADNYLKHPHRHIMHVTCKKKVSHNNREIEFIAFKEGIQEFIRCQFIPLHSETCPSISCEDIAEKLCSEFELNYCSVLEDNENGAEVICE